LKNYIYNPIIISKIYKKEISEVKKILNELENDPQALEKYSIIDKDMRNYLKLLINNKNFLE